MHMLSRKDLNSAELDTVRVSRKPTTGITANGEVQTNEEATVRLRFGFILDNTDPRGYACISIAWKHCEDHGYFFELVKNTSHKNDRKSNVTQKTLYRSLSQDFRPVLPVRLQVHLLHRERRIQQKTSRQVQRPHNVEVHAVQ